MAVIDSLAHANTTNHSLSQKNWAAIILLGLSGQLAWSVENQFFNTFMYNNITPDPRPISWMVAITSVVSTLTAIFMGTLSDRTRTRWGRRKPYLLFGYLAWGVMTALFPSASFFRPVGMAIFMAILFDCVMTYFGATANDASFNAFLTDATTTENRGRVMGVSQILVWVATLIVYAGGGPIINSFGYFTFFYMIGGVVFLFGLVGGFLIHEPPVTDQREGTYWSQLTGILQWKKLTANKDFFLLMIAVLLWATAFNIFFPYIIIYLQNYLRLDMMTSSITLAVAILIGGIFMAWPFGILVDRWGRKPVALCAVGAEMVGLILFSLTRSLVPLVITGILWLAPFTAWQVASSTWSKDLFPEDRRGQFAGVNLIFSVMLPMIIGPLTGGWISSAFGIKTVIDGQAAIIPTPLLFQVAGIATLLAAVPLFFVKQQEMPGRVEKEMARD